MIRSSNNESVFIAKMLLLRLDPNEVNWHQVVVLFWVVMILIEEVQKVCNEDLTRNGSQV